MAVKEKIRIRLQSYDAQLIDAAAEKIVETAKHTGARVSGPIPLPTDREIVTVLRATHKYKDSREQFESRTHKRLIDILKPSNKIGFIGDSYDVFQRFHAARRAVDVDISAVQFFFQFSMVFEGI